MKTQNGFLGENWTLKRVLKFSITIAFLYAILALLVSKPESFSEIKLLAESDKVIISSLRSFSNVLSNFIGLTLCGLGIFWILRYFDSKLRKVEIDKKDLIFALFLTGGLGLCAMLGSTFAEEESGLIVFLVTGSTIGVGAGIIKFIFKILLGWKTELMIIASFGLTTIILVTLFNQIYVGIVYGLAVFLSALIVMRFLQILIQLFLEFGKGAVNFWKFLVSE